MHVDFLTLACLRDDLDRLLGARVQDIVLPDDLSVGLELYAGQRYYLLLSAHAQHARVLLSRERLRRGREAETPLLLLLRKWVRGAHLTDILQPPWERMLLFEFDGAQGRCQLVAEIMDRYSNVVLVGPDGCVLDALKRIGAQLNRYRVTLPGHPYQPPPRPLNRQPPPEVEWPALLAGAPPDQPLHQVLTGHLLGVSPTLAREVATRAAVDPLAAVRAAAPPAVADALSGLLAPLNDGAWQPHVALDDEGCVIAFAPYLPRQFGRAEATMDISAAMARYFAGRVAADPYAAARRAVQALIDAVAGRIGLALTRLQEQLPSAQEIEALRQQGELLLAYQAQVPPAAERVSLASYSGQTCVIVLDPALTPVENAQAYFRRYAKARRAATEVPPRVEVLEAGRAYLEQLAADLAIARTRPEIDAVRAALAAAGWAAKPRQRSAPAGGPLRLAVDGFTVYVGRNAGQNEEVTFKLAGPDDLWLHVRGQPGAHVIVKGGGRETPEEVIRHAAGLAVQHSRVGCESGRIPVSVTQRRFVRRVPGGHPGMVTYRNERTVWVRSVCPAS
jgi:predicted ribosome quality control (RQC) complex YloA/Tae2 family protein